jgi:acetyl esterase
MYVEGELGRIQQMKDASIEWSEPNINFIRQQHKFIVDGFKDEIYQKYQEQATCEEIIIENATAFGTDAETVKVFVQRKKSQENEVKPCIIFYHGGGTVMFSAKDYIPICARMATQFDCVIVNVDYRLNPEHKSPKCVMDCYAAFKWVV